MKNVKLNIIMAARFTGNLDTSENSMHHQVKSMWTCLISKPWTFFHTAITPLNCSKEALAQIGSVGHRCLAIIPSWQ